MEKMFKRLLSFAVALFLVLGMVPASVFAAENGGYMLTIYNEDGTEAMTIDGTKSASEFNVGTALEDAYTFGDNAFLFGITGTPTYELQLLQDVEITEMVAIAAGKNVVIDLNGYAITSGYQTDSTTKHIYPFDVYGNLTIKNSAGNGSISGRGIYVRDGGTLTVESGTIYGIDSNGGSALYQYGGNIVINGGTIEQTAAGTYNYAIYAGGGTITINGGTIIGKHGALSVSGAAATVNGGELICTGNEGWTDNVIYVSAGSLTVNDGTILHKGNEVGGDSGAAVVAANDTVTIDIKDGSFTGYNGSVSGNANTTISGGSFSTTLGYDGWDNLKNYVVPGATVTIEGETYTAEAAKTAAGTVNGCFIMNPDGESYITTAINNLYAEESVVLKLTDAEGTLLATSSLVDTDRALLGKELAEISGTILIVKEDAWWNTQWEEGKLSAAYVPATITLFVDGQEMNSTPALIRNNVELPLNWAEVNGVQAAAPELPTATVTELDVKELDDAAPELTFAMNFTADPATAEQLAYYGEWTADYILTSNKDIVFDANGTGNGYLAGEYGTWGWISVPDGQVTLPANTPVPVIATAMELLGYSTALTYETIYEGVQSFTCGLFLNEEFLAANPDLEVTLALRIYNPENDQESYTIGETYTFTAPAPKLPTATVTEIENDDLTFALNFKADDATQAQIDYYGDWYADYVLTVNKKVTFNADGTADGWLSGQYDDYSENWVNVPFEDVTLEAGESIKIMEYASIALNQPGLKLTYNDVLSFVKDFDCGVFFDEEFLANNPDLVVTLELRTYNNEDETESYVIGETYTFTAPAPELPTATTTEIENDDLTFAMNFKADEATYAQLYHYGSWYADFVLTVNKDVTFNADGGADGYLSGQYDSWSENWVDVPYGKGNVNLAAGEELQIMKFAAELMGKTGLRYTYKEVYEVVKDFDCGVYFTPEFLAANPDLVVTLELRIYNPADETENYLIGETYVFTLGDNVAENVQTGKQYPTVTAALAESQEGETVRLLKNVEGEKAEEIILILNDRTLDLNGFTLEATNVVAVTGGAKITDSTNGKGLLKVAKANLTLPSNDQLPIWSAEDAGYRFVTVETKHWEVAKTAEYLTMMFWFTGALDGDMKHHLAKVEENELKVVLRVEYARPDGSSAILDIVVPQDKVLAYANTEVEPYFLITIRGLNSLGDATITTYVISGDVEVSDESYDYTAVTE